MHRARRLPLLLACALGPSAALYAAPPTAPTAPAIRVLSKEDLPATAKIDGRLERALAFDDRAGENLVLVTTREVRAGSADEPQRSFYLTVQHLIRAGGKTQTARTIRDQEERCELDLSARVLLESLQVTDLDRDGTGEVTFAYDLGCRSDVSPDPRKLVVLQGGQKYILRGQSRVDTGAVDARGKSLPERYVGGDFKADPDERRWPRPLYDHAVAVWKRLLVPAT